MTTVSGLAASTGIAIGPLFVYRPASLTVPHRDIDDLDEERARYDRSRTAVAAVLRGLAESLEQAGKDEEAGIFEIQLEFLEDPTFGEAIAERIGDDRVNAEYAVDAVTRELVEEFASIEDDYFAQRTADIRDLGDRVIRHLLGITERALDTLSEPSVVLAHDLTPSDTAAMDPEQVLALVTEVGSATSHTAILSRGLGIPSIVGLGTVPDCAGETVVVDAIKGAMIIDPDPDTLASYRSQRDSWYARRERLVASAGKPAQTTDGVRVEVVANIGSLPEARQSLAFGAEGVGLLRTEFLFLERSTLPTEDEQYAVYRQIADVYGKRPLIVRTLDVGGDKPLPSVHMPPEENPFLGRRAIRLALSDPERLLYPQLRALLRASHERNLKIMFPMVATTGEIRTLRSALDTARAELDDAGQLYNPDLEVGIMVEIPAAAVAAHRLAPLVDFFSIGTNDLTQYTLAVDRTNETVASIADYFDPAVVDLIRNVIDASHAHGIWTGMCGEMAGDPVALPLLLGLGLDEFSMAPASVPDAKDRLRNLSREECRELAARCLSADSAASIRAILEPVAAES